MEWFCKVKPVKRLLLAAGLALFFMGTADASSYFGRYDRLTNEEVAELFPDLKARLANWTHVETERFTDAYSGRQEPVKNDCPKEPAEAPSGKGIPTICLSAIKRPPVPRYTYTVRTAGDLFESSPGVCRANGLTVNKPAGAYQPARPCQEAGLGDGECNIVRTDYVWMPKREPRGGCPATYDTADLVALPFGGVAEKETARLMALLRKLFIDRNVRRVYFGHPDRRNLENGALAGLLLDPESSRSYFETIQAVGIMWVGIEPLGRPTEQGSLVYNVRFCGRDGLRCDVGAVGGIPMTFWPRSFMIVERGKKIWLYAPYY